MPVNIFNILETPLKVMKGAKKILITDHFTHLRWNTGEFHANAYVTGMNHTHESLECHLISRGII